MSRPARPRNASALIVGGLALEHTGPSDERGRGQFEYIAEERIGRTTQRQPTRGSDDLPDLGGKSVEQAVGRCRRKDQGQRSGPEPIGQATADV